MDCGPPGSSVHGILQAKILEWVTIPFSRGSSWPRDRTWVSHVASRFFTVWSTREVSSTLSYGKGCTVMLEIKRVESCSNFGAQISLLLLLLLLSCFSHVRICVISVRFPHPWDSPGKNTGVDCHFLLQCMKVKSQSEVTQSCPTLSDCMDCSPPGSSIHGIFQGSPKISLFKNTFYYEIFQIHHKGQRPW